MSYYDWEEPETLEDRGYIHQHYLPNLDHVKEMLKTMINTIYITGDVELLDDCLDELVGVFGLQLPNTKPLLEKKAKRSVMIDSWLEFNQDYNEQIATR
jgi:hypothetical protein